MPGSDIVKVATLRGVDAFRESLADLGIELPVEQAIEQRPGSPLAQPAQVLGRAVGNRFAIQPMEGWDGTADGRPSERTVRRWRNFGLSGAKLVWGGEAVAVRHDGRANPNQLMLTDATAASIAGLREQLVAAHRETHGTADDLLIGLQLTHSGRFSRPNGPRLEPWIAYHHPLLDGRFGIAPDHPVVTDAQVDDLIGDFARAAVLAQRCGFDFVDVKHCHGYLGHELLSAVVRPGRYGGSLQGRTRFMREAVEAIRRDAPGLGIAVRLSAFDSAPFIADPTRSEPGRPGPGIAVSTCECSPYVYAFGCDPDQPTDVDLTEPVAVLEMLGDLGVTLVNLTAGSPYYCPHIQRPALYPPSDGYQPPEDPLVGVARQMHVTRYLKAAVPGMTVVGTAYSYLQDYLPHVAQGAVRDGWVDFVGLGRMVLSYPEMPADILDGRPLQARKVCRTFSDCTTAPRQGLPSGCYPLDPSYKHSAEAEQLAAAKRAIRRRD